MNVTAGKWATCAAGLLALAAAASTAQATGYITGQGQFERIAGNPAMGYQRLYEWDLYLSPEGGSGYVGPSRRLGAPPGQVPTGDGFYRIDDVPAGQYSLYVNQPDFFASPKVVPNVAINDGQGTTLNVNLDVDYSTYFSQPNQWTEWLWDTYQTFTATGTSVRGISWRLAGHGENQSTVRILESNGSPDVRNWAVIGTGIDTNIGANTDNWVRFDSGDVPLTPGKQYAVHLHVDGGMAVYKRDKDANSYVGGRAYDNNGAARNYDLNVTVFVDRDNTIVTHTRKSSGPGVFDGNNNGTRWSQSFTATGQSLAAVDLFAAGSAGFTIEWRIRQGGPNGTQIGQSKTVASAFFASSTALAGVSFNPGEIPLIAGQTYYIEAYNPGGFTPYLNEAWNSYSDGQAYRNGSPINGDLAMTIVEYSFPSFDPDRNGDGVVNAADIDLMFDDPIDLNRDGARNQLDIDHLITEVLGTTYGDANLNGVVNMTDYQIAVNNFYRPGGWAMGNFNGDARIDLSDLRLIKEHFTAGQAAFEAAIHGAPMPPAALMGAVLMGAMVLRRRA